MDEQALTLRIDEALREFTSRDLISGAEVVDFLLDLRLMLLAAEEAEAARHQAEAASRREPRTIRCLSPWTPISRPAPPRSVPW